MSHSLPSFLLRKELISLALLLSLGTGSFLVRGYSLGRMVPAAKDSRLNSLLPPTPAPSSTPPLADAYVSASNPTASYGASYILSTRLNSYESYLKFNVSSISGAVKLQLYGQISSTSATNITVGAYAVADTSWAETGTTWNNKPPVSSLLSTVVVTDNVLRLYEWDVTAYVQSEKAAGRNTISLALKSTVASSPYITFNTREAASKRPQLAGYDHP
jgi:hypothetical protein